MIFSLKVMTKREPCYKKMIVYKEGNISNNLKRFK